MEINKKAVIIGCGIAGPVVALFLRRAGIDAEIYEAQAATDDQAGSFLNVAANGMDVLATLGLSNQLLAEGFPCSRMIMWSGRGKQLGEVRNAGSQDPDATSVIIKRKALHRIVRTEAIRQGINIAFDKRLVDIQVADAVVGEPRVTAHFADGTTATGDLLIGCDGIHSRTRQFVLPHAPPPVYTGLVSASGFAHHDKLSPTPNTQHFVFGKRAFFGYLVKPDGETYWFENHDMLGEPRRSDLAAISQPAWREKLLALHRHDPSFISEMICATTGDMAVYPIYDIPMLSRWHKGPVMLIGDAAHATSPSAGQGASLALEDAIVLAQCLRDIPSRPDAFATFEGLRRGRAEKIVKFSRQRGSNKALANPVARWFRDLMMPFFLKRFANATSFAWLYHYKVDWQQKITKVEGQTA